VHIAIFALNRKPSAITPDAVAGTCDDHTFSTQSGSIREHLLFLANGQLAALYGLRRSSARPYRIEPRFFDLCSNSFVRRRAFPCKVYPVLVDGVPSGAGRTDFASVSHKRFRGRIM
jgi:hypothetical protein